LGGGKKLIGGGVTFIFGGVHVIGYGQISNGDGWIFTTGG